MSKKSYKFLGILLSVCILLSIVPTFAFAAVAGETFTDGLFTYTVNTDGTTVTLTSIAASSLSGEVVIPKTVTDGTNTFTVTKLGAAFKGSDNTVAAKTNAMTKLVMADTITEITVTSPFYACRFTEVHLSSGLTKHVNDSTLMNTFNQCNLLYTVNIPAGITLLNGTFYSAPSVKNVILEGTAVRTLYMDSTAATSHAFADGKAINFYVPYTATPASLFDRMGSGKITPSYLYYEGDYVFDMRTDGSGTVRMYSLLPGKTFGETVVIPQTLGGKTVTQLYLYSYRNNTVTKSFTMPDTVNTIDSGTFYGWKALENVHLSAALTNGGAANQMSNTFYYCTKLTSVEIPAGITKLYGTFRNSAVKTVTLKTTAQADFYGSSGTSDARAWLDGTTGIKIYYPYNGTAPTRTGTSFTATVERQAAPTVEFTDGDFIYVATAGSQTVTLKSVAASKLTGDVAVPSTVSDGTNTYTVTAIGNQALSNQNEVTSLTLPTTVKTIGFQAFMEMDGLKSFDMPDSVETIGYGLFYGCNNLEEVKLSKNLKGTMQTTFAYCSKLKNCIIPDGVTTLNKTFMYCNIINLVVVPASVTTITGDTDDKSALFSTFLDAEGKTIGAPTEPGFVVMGTAGSAIQTYMNDKNWNFKAIDFDMPFAIQAPKPHLDKTVTVNVANIGKADKAADMTVYCAYYDKEDGRLIDVGLIPLSVVKVLDVEEVTVTMNEGYDAMRVYAHAFVWEDGTLIPFAEMAELYETVGE